MSGSAAAMHIGVRRSRRLAERRGDDEVCTPAAPKLDDHDAPQFPGPRPAWLTGQDTRSDTLPPSPQRGAGDEPRVLPPLTQSAIRHMPTDEGAVGLGLVVPKGTRPKSPTHEPSSSPVRAASSLSACPSSQSTPDLGAEDWPWHEPLVKLSVPPTPRIGTLDSGRFSPVLLPEPDTHLVPADHPEAEVPQRRSSRMQRSVTMKREYAVDLERMPTGGLGLGIDVDPVDAVSKSIQSMSISQEQRRTPLRDKTPQAPRNNALCDKSQAKTNQLSKAGKAGKAGKAPSLPCAGPVDENGCPIAYTIPTKQYTVPTYRKARSSTSHTSVQRERLTIAYKPRRAGMQPAIEVHARKMYTLR